jgi:hypothetical protein
MSFKESDVSEHLEGEGATARAAGRAAREIVARWNDREFWLSATLDPLKRCVAASPGMSAAREVLDRLTFAVGAKVHDVPAWEPRRPMGRHEGR